MGKKKRAAAPDKEQAAHHDPRDPLGHSISKPTRQQEKIQEAIKKFLVNEKPLFAHLIGEDALENLLKRFIGHLSMNELELVITSDIASVPYHYLVFHSRLP